MDDFWQNGKQDTWDPPAGLNWPEPEQAIDILAGIDEPVIDFGCGYGRLAPLFMNHMYLGLDHDKFILRKAKIEYPNHIFKPTDDPYIDYLIKNNRVTFAYNVLKHVPDETIEDVADLIANISLKFILGEVMGVRDVKDYIEIFGPMNVVDTWPVEDGKMYTVMQWGI